MTSDAGRVLVTGVGVVSPFGRGVGAFWQALCEGRVARSGHIESYRPPANLDSDAQAHLGRCSLIAVDAAIQAVEDAAMPFTAQTAALIGVVLGSELGEVERPIPGAPATSVARVLGVAGPVISFSGLGSGLAAIVEGFEIIKRGASPVVVAGGVDALPADVSGSPAEAPGRPFDRDRGHAGPAEGAAVIVLEDSEIALARNARVYGEVLGGGLAFSRATVMSPAPNLVDAARAMRAALLRAEVFQGEIETIFAAANGDALLDEVEARAIMDLWGPNADRLTVTSVHGATGHSHGAAGALSLIAAIKSLEQGVVPAAAGCENIDGGMATLDIVTGASRAWRYNTAMVNALCEGTNVSVVVRA